MTDDQQSLKSVMQALESAHQQLIERDQCINDLLHENAALTTELRAVYQTRVWRCGERYRRLRAAVMRH